ncbi:MAG: PHP domain-containing protein [Nanoarchaeota archaeon]|nr:PHP domain-containing protein [Nanoarchaeota archaeon]
MSEYIRGRPHKERFPGKRAMDLHIHTEHSVDCDTKVKQVLRVAEKHGFGISITDHNAIGGSLEALKQDVVPVVPGIEITAAEGIDVLCYFKDKDTLVRFFDEDIKPNMKNNLFRSSRLKGEEVIARAKKLGGVTAFAHPYRYILRLYSVASTLPVIKKYFSIFDAVEVINGKSPQVLNRRALRKAQLFNKPFMSGSDAHELSDLMVTFTLFDSDDPAEVVESIRNGDTIVIGRGSKALLKLLRSGKKIIVKKYNEATHKGKGAQAAEQH